MPIISLIILYHNTMTKLISVNNEILDDNIMYKRTMMKKQKDIRENEKTHFDERNTYSTTLKSIFLLKSQQEIKVSFITRVTAITLFYSRRLKLLI